MTRLARHKLAWLSEEGWREAIEGLPESCRTAALQWRDKKWPAIVRRNDADASEEHACLGIALPPVPDSGLKRRIGFRVRAACIEKLADPLELKHVIPVAPLPWQPHLAALEKQAAQAGLRLRAYGSAALQCMTGQPYMTPSSDLDLLFHPRTPAELADGLALLSFFAAVLPLDGEVIFPSGQAVAWKEWLNAEQTGNASRVLAKDMQTVRLMKMNELLATLETQPCTL